MKAGEFLTKQKHLVLPLIVYEDELIDDVLQKLLKFRTYQLVYVQDKEEKLVGYIPSSTLIKHYASEHVVASEGHTFAGQILHYVTSMHARDIMKKRILYCYEEEELSDIFLQMMKEKHPYVIAVLNDKEEHVGFLDLLDMTEEIIAESDNDEA